MEKNVTFGPFIDRLATLSDVRFLFVYRDGRDVVTSLINWHDHLFGERLPRVHGARQPHR